MAVLTAAAALAGCGVSFDRGTVSIDTQTGPVTFTVDVADSPRERVQGLKRRRSLAERGGLLLLHSRDTRAGIVMRDTLVPLTVAFVAANGRIDEVVDLEPCEAEPCPVHQSERPYRFALEVRRGALGRAGVEVGDSVAVELEASEDGLPAWGYAALVWAVSLPLAFAFATSRGFLRGPGPLVALRVPAVAFVAPALALTALIAGLVALAARGLRG